MRWYSQYPQGSVAIAAAGLGTVFGAVLGWPGLLVGLGLLLLGIVVSVRNRGTALTVEALGGRVENILRLAEENASEHLAEARQQAADLVAAAETRARDIVAEAETRVHGMPTTPAAVPAQTTDAVTLTDPPSSSL